MKRVAALAAFQVLAIVGWASYHEHVWATAETFRIPLRPYDPFDAIRGRYFVLNPADATVESGNPWLPREQVDRLLGSSDAFSGTVQVGFCPAGETYRACALALPGEAASGSARFWGRGFATLSRQGTGWKLRLDLGLRRFFIPNQLQLPAAENQEGWEVEVSHRPGLSLLPRRLVFKGAPIDIR
jgi:hypothetical protein